MIVEASKKRPAAVPEVGFEEWVRPHLTAMARLAARLAPDADRDDVVQEALTRAWLKRAQYDHRRGSPVTWLLTITADQARKARGRGPIRADAGGTQRGESRIEERLDLADAIRRLAPRQRMAVDCVYFVGLTVTETAAVMGCSVGTVKSTLADARHRLRAVLGTPS